MPNARPTTGSGASALRWMIPGIRMSPSGRGRVFWARRSCVCAMRCGVGNKSINARGAALHGHFARIYCPLTHPAGKIDAMVVIMQYFFMRVCSMRRVRCTVGNRTPELRPLHPYSEDSFSASEMASAFSRLHLHISQRLLIPAIRSSSSGSGWFPPAAADRGTYRPPASASGRPSQC